MIEWFILGLTALVAVTVFSISNDVSEIKEKLKIDNEPPEEYRPPITELSKEQMQLLEGLAAMLSFDGTLPDGDKHEN